MSLRISWRCSSRFLALCSVGQLRLKPVAVRASGASGRSAGRPGVRTAHALASALAFWSFVWAVAVQVTHQVRRAAKPPRRNIRMAGEDPGRTLVGKIRRAINLIAYTHRGCCQTESPGPK